MDNKKRLITGLSFNKIADLLISAKTTLTALMLAAGVPTWMISWLVPIRESGALLPQALLSIYLSQKPYRHKVWRIGMFVQLSSITAVLISFYFSSGITTGVLVLSFLATLSLGRSICSLTLKDIAADVAAKGERGKLLGKAATISGVCTLLIALPLVSFDEKLDQLAITMMLAISILCFAFTLVWMWPLKTEVEIAEKSGFKLQADKDVIKFILVRGLFVHSALVAPYFMLEKQSEASDLLPIYIASEALAALISSYIWGNISDKSAKLTLQLAGFLAFIACAGLLFIDSPSLWISAGLFFVLSVAHTGVRSGRKTYSLDVKSGHKRTELVGFSNTAIGLILLAFGAIYALLTPILPFSVVYIMTAMLLFATLSTLFLTNEK